MNSLRRWMLGSVCAWVAIAWGGVAHAQLTTAVNPTSLPLGSCSPGTLNAVPNDSTPDTGAFQCALGLIPASGGEIYIPPGSYILTDTLTVVDKPVAFRGEGQRITTLYWDNVGASGNGIDFTSTNLVTNYQLTVKSMSLLRRAGTGGTAIVGTWPTPSAPAHRSLGGTSATIFDVHIGNEQDQESAYWTFGIRLANALGARINVFNIHMANQEHPSSLIALTGQSTDVTISGGNLGRAWFGVLVVGAAQNVRIENVETSENHIGFYIEGGKHHVISNVHGGVVDQGVQILDGSDVTITDSFFYARSLQRPGIEISNPTVPGDGFEVRGNFVYDFPHGITLEGAITNSRVTGNRLQVATNAVHFKNGVTTSAIIGNSSPSNDPIVVDCPSCNQAPANNLATTP
jgi:hypothetical protein